MEGNTNAQKINIDETGSSYVSNELTISSSGSWTNLNFTFPQIIPKGKYLVFTSIGNVANANDEYWFNFDTAGLGSSYQSVSCKLQTGYGGNAATFPSVLTISSDVPVGTIAFTCRGAYTNTTTTHQSNNKAKAVLVRLF